MSALELVKALYKGTNVTSESTTGISKQVQALDCNCVDCGDSADCSTPW